MIKVLYLIPRTVDAVLQQTTENELAYALQRQGHYIETVVAYHDVQSPMNGFNYVNYIHTPKGSVYGKFKYHLKMLLSAWRTDADVIMLGYPVGHLLPLIKVCSLWRKCPKMIMDIRSVPVDVEAGLFGHIRMLRYRSGLMLANIFCDGMTAITPMLADTLKRYVKQESIGVWASGVNLDMFKREGPSKRNELGLGNKTILFYHGVLSANRGIQNAIRAVKILENQYPSLIFVLLGDGDGKQEMLDLVAELGLSERVKFLGQVDYEKVPEYVRMADIGILPFPDITWWRVSSPIKLMEYLAMGVPVVATDIDANRIVLNETAGGVLSVDDQPESLVSAIKHIIENNVESASIEKLENTISWNQQARQLVKYIEAL